jgi:hypothetical protein
VLSDLTFLHFSLVSAKRFIDNVPYVPIQLSAPLAIYLQLFYRLAVDHEIVRGLERGIRGALFKGLGLGSEDGYQRCRDLLQEPSGTVSRRNELNKKRERLYKGAFIFLPLSQPAVGW